MTFSVPAPALINSSVFHDPALIGEAFSGLMSPPSPALAWSNFSDGSGQGFVAFPCNATASFPGDVLVSVAAMVASNVFTLDDSLLPLQALCYQTPGASSASACLAAVSTPCTSTVCENGGSCTLDSDLIPSCIWFEKGRGGW